jgi:hypothetical protein
LRLGEYQKYRGRRGLTRRAGGAEAWRQAAAAFTGGIEEAREEAGPVRERPEAGGVARRRNNVEPKQNGVGL